MRLETHGPTHTDEHSFDIYAAGYTDGEGCWYASPKGGVKVVVWSTFPFVLFNLMDRYGGMLSSRPANPPRWRAAYEWALYGEDAVDFSLRLMPHLHEKRQQAQLLIDIYKSQPRSALRERLINDLRAAKKNCYDPPGGES